MFTTLVFTALAVCLGTVLCGPFSDKVEIGFYSEALCPDCLSFSNGPLTEAFKEASLLMGVNKDINPSDISSVHFNLITHECHIPYIGEFRAGPGGEKSPLNLLELPEGIALTCSDWAINTS